MTLSIQDVLVILGPIGTLMGFMWHHSNTKFEKIDEKFEKIDEKFERLDEKFERLDEKIDKLRIELKADINSVDKRLGEKIDAVRDRVSRIEGQLAPASIVAFNPPRHKEPTRATHFS